MHKLSDKIERKFIDTIDISDWEIESDTGWVDATAIHKTIPYEVWEIKTKDGSDLLCADTHIVFDENLNEIFVKDCIPNITKIITKTGPQLVVSVSLLGRDEEMFDITVDSIDHRFWSGNILSHNTETCAAYILWYLLFNVDRTSAILANKEATASEIVSRVQGMYYRVPLWMQSGVEVWNTTSFLLENGSRLISSATSSDAIRGFRIDCLMLDEYGHVDNSVAEDFFTSVYPTISSGKRSKVIICSTPNGLNHFYKIFTDAVNHKKTGSQFKHVKVTWDQVPGRNKLWEQDMKLQLGEEKFEQEQNVEFQGSGGTLISSKALRNLTFKEPLQELLDHKLKIYEEVKEGHRYVITVDVSHGKELDYSAMSVIDVTQMPYRQVATYHSNEVPAELYPSIIAQIGQLYNSAYVLCESNDIGTLVIKILIDDLEYENIFYTESDKVYRDTKATEGVLRSPGVKTSNKIKRQGCNTLKQLIEREELLVEDFETISELSTFVIKKNKTYAADEGKHDDLVMTFVLFSWLCTQQFFKDLAHSDARSELYRDSHEQIGAEIPLPPMLDTADPGPGRFVEDGTLWEEVNSGDADLKWSGFTTLN